MQWVRCLYEEQLQEPSSLRRVLLQGTSLGLVVTSALIIWNCLILLTGSESPVVVVLSESMQPGFYRGDILFLWHGAAAARAGDIIVFSLDHRQSSPREEAIPIVHRAIQVHERRLGGQIDILTKGDFNEMDDRAGGIYDGIDWLHASHVSGKVVGYLPYVGQVTLLMNDYPKLKYALIAMAGYFLLTSKD